MSRPPEFLTGTYAWDYWETLGAIPPPGHHDRSPGLVTRTRNMLFCYSPAASPVFGSQYPPPHLAPEGPRRPARSRFDD